MNKFKKGDRVQRQSGHFLGMGMGDVATVSADTEGPHHMTVYLDEYPGSSHATERLRLFSMPVAGKERDPSGLSLNTPGAKADAGKLRPTLVIRDMANALQAVIKIATDGAAKYTEGGWLQVPNGEVRYDDADLRHMLKRYADGPNDADSGSLHLAHEAWNALAKLELALRAEKAAGK